MSSLNPQEMQSPPTENCGSCSLLSNIRNSALEMSGLQVPIMILEAAILIGLYSRAWRAAAIGCFILFSAFGGLTVVMALDRADRPCGFFGPFTLDPLWRLVIVIGALTYFPRVLVPF